MQNENEEFWAQFDSQQTQAVRTGEQPAGPAGLNQPAPQDFIQMKGWIQQAREDAQRARTIAEQSREDIREIERELDATAGKSRRAGWMAAILALALIGVCAWGYSRLSSDASLMTQFPAVQTALNAVGQRMNAAEEKFRNWTGDWDQMDSRLSKVEKTAGATLAAAKSYATEQASKAQRQMQAEMNNRSRATDESIAKIQATHEEDQRQIAELQQKLGDVRSEASQQLARSQQETGEKLGDLRAAVDHNRDDVSGLAHTLAKTRLDFEVTREKTREVAPGVTLTVSGVNVAYQRVEGRAFVIGDGRVLWIRGQGIQQPVWFYSHKDNRPYELVFTRVAKDAAVGYVLIPENKSPENKSDDAQSSLQNTAALAANSAPSTVLPAP